MCDAEDEVESLEQQIEELDKEIKELQAEIADLKSEELEWGNCKRGCEPAYLNPNGFCSPGCELGGKRGN